MFAPMRILGWSVLTLTTSVGIALLLHFNEGNVVIVSPPYRIDLSLNLALILLAAFFFFLYAFIRLGVWTFSFSSRLKTYRNQRYSERNILGMQRALLAYAEGRFARAEREAEVVAKNSDEDTGGTQLSLLAWLIAARSSHIMQEYERRDLALNAASDTVKDHSALKPALLMTQAELYLDQLKVNEALGVLNDLHAGGRRHVHSMRLAMRVYREQGNWAEVLRLARALVKRNALHPIAAERLISQAASQQIRSLSGDLSGLLRVCKDFRTQERAYPEVALAIAQAFFDLDQMSTVRQALEYALSTDWDPRLLEAYAHLAKEDILERLEKAEFWLATRPNDAKLLQSLGALCLKAQLWGPAQRYLERSLLESENAQTHRLMAELNESKGDFSKAAEHWRLAALAVGNTGGERISQSNLLNQ